MLDWNTIIIFYIFMEFDFVGWLERWSMKIEIQKSQLYCCGSVQNSNAIH